MKKFIFGIMLALTVPAFAFAAPTGWKPASECTVPPDHGIWDDSNTKLTGCITDEAWKAAASASSIEQSTLGQYIFPANSTKRGSDGVLYGCFVGQPWFFMFSCILPPQAR